jgi:4-amino-4-deoxy-L-arabinose transferase-like glycosyltransferase
MLSASPSLPPEAKTTGAALSQSLWSRHPAVAAFAVSLLFLLLGNGSHSLWDRDEPRNATASRNMLRTGDWVTPTFNGELRAHKPVLVNWTQAASLAVMGGKDSTEPGWQEFAVRLPSSVAGAVTVGLTVRLALILGLSVLGASVAGGLVLLSPLFIMVHKAATTDGILIAATWWAITLWFQQRRGFCWFRHVYFGVAAGLTVLQKGPVGPLLLLLLCVFPLAGSKVLSGVSIPPVAWPGRILRWSVTVSIVLFMVMPWVVAVYVETEGEFLREALGKHVIQRAAGKGLDGHAGPIWFYLPVLLLMTLPWLPLAVQGVAESWKKRRTETHWPFGILLLWTLATVAVFSLFRTKLPHYILPILPAIALVVARGMTSIPGGERGWIRHLGYGLYGLGGAVGLLVIGFFAWGGYLPEDLKLLQVPGALLGLIVSITSLVALIWWHRRRVEWLVATLTVALPLFMGLLFFAVMPIVDPLRASPVLARAVMEIAPDAKLAAVGYQEPSLVWYHGRDIEMYGRRRPDGPLEFLGAGGRRLVVVEKPVFDKWNRDTTASLPIPVWTGKALNLQSEVFSTLHILDSDSTGTVESLRKP